MVHLLRFAHLPSPHGHTVRGVDCSEVRLPCGASLSHGRFLRTGPLRTPRTLVGASAFVPKLADAPPSRKRGRENDSSSLTCGKQEGSRTGGQHEGVRMRYRCAVLDDYQNVALRLADWGQIAADVDVTVFNKPMSGPDEVHRTLKDFHIVCMMRERTPFRRNTIEALPNLKLIITTGARNASIDMAPAVERGITVCGGRSRGLVTAKEFALMKPTAYIINTARGPIIEEKALIAALDERRIAGAGLDVFDIEPLPLDHPFRRMDNVVITPHLGYVSQQNYQHYFPDIGGNIRAFIDCEPGRRIR